MGLLDRAKLFVGQSWIGTNQYDKGQCVGLFNVVVQDFYGQPRNWYPIQGAGTAYQLLTANNTRPDLMTQVKNDPANLNQLPSVGDALIWNSNIGDGAGHVAFVESVNASQIVTIDQNWTPNTVTRVTHNWSNVAGWIHFNANDVVAPPPSDPCQSVKDENASLKAQLGTANATITQRNQQVSDLTNQVNDLTTKLNSSNTLLAEAIKKNEALQSENDALKAKLAATGEDTLMLNAFGKVLNWFLVRVGITK